MKSGKKKRPVRIPVTTGRKKKDSAKEPDSAQEKITDSPPAAPKDTEVETRATHEENLAALRRKAQEYDELLEILQRLKAEYANYQKRTERERGEYRQECVREILLKMLPVVDNIERALSAAKQHKGSGELLSGVGLVHKQFLQVLEAEEVRPFESRGKKFDPHRHDAVMLEETDEAPPDTVVSQMQRGYMIGEKVLRAARVTVSRRPEKPAEPEE